MPILYFSLLVLLSSCSSFNFKVRQGKNDVSLGAAEYRQLKGTFSNLSIDTDSSHFRRTLYENLTYDTIGKRLNNYYVDVSPISKNNLKLELFSQSNKHTESKLLRSLTLKGKFKRGYFKVRTKYPPGFILGPLLWVFGIKASCIGLTRDNNLVILDSHGGILLLVIIPIFAGGGDTFEYEYARIK